MTMPARNQAAFWVEYAVTSGQYVDPTPTIRPVRGESRNQNEAALETTTDGDDGPVWQDEANCLGVDPKLFFPARGDDTKDAKEVCRGCVVRGECLDAGLHEKYGIWGGMSERERRRIRKQRAQA